MLGAIEAGGTKFVCAVGDETRNILERIQIPTIFPKETMSR
ncbi:ROK family protein [Bacillus sp. EB106-08-02-XG196]|nr:ROK family protein [Bacillus sp. EB106-08-02-XG196]